MGHCRGAVIAAIAALLLSEGATSPIAAQLPLDQGPTVHHAAFHRYVIVGGGPAGLQLAHYLGTAGRDYVLLDKASSVGSFFERFPRWRTLISINKVNTGRSELDAALRMDWNSLLSEPSSSDASSVGVDFGASAIPCLGAPARTCWAADYSSTDPRRTRDSVPAELSFRHFSREYFPHADDLVAYLRSWSRPDAPRGAAAGGAAVAAVTANAGARLSRSLALRFNATVSRVERLSHAEEAAAVDGARFILHLGGGGTLRCRFLLWTAGLQRLQHADGVNVGSVAQNYWTHSTNLSDYEDKSVLLLGRGNSAFEIAHNVLPVASMVHILGRDSGRIRLATETHYPGDVRHVHSSLLETYLLKSGDGLAEGPQTGLQLFFDNATSRYTVIDTSTRCETDVWGRSTSRCFFNRKYDKVISCPGWRFDPSPFAPSAAPALAKGGKYPALKPTYESTNVTGLYFAGTLAHVMDHRISSGGFIHGFRYAARALHRILEEEEQREQQAAAAVGGSASPSWPPAAIAAQPSWEWLPSVHDFNVRRPLQQRAATAAGMAQLAVHGAAEVVARLLPEDSTADAGSTSIVMSHASSTAAAAAEAAAAAPPALGWPRRYTSGLRSLTSAILRRVNTASGPYQMFSTISDMVVFPPLNRSAVSALGFKGVGVSGALVDPFSYPDATVRDSSMPQPGFDGFDVDDDARRSPELVLQARLQRLSAPERRALLRRRPTERAIDAALTGAVLEEVPVALAPERACDWAKQTAAVMSAAGSGPRTAAVVGEGLASRLVHNHVHATPHTPSVGFWCEYALVTLEFAPQEVGGKKVVGHATPQQPWELRGSSPGDGTSSSSDSGSGSYSSSSGGDDMTRFDSPPDPYSLLRANVSEWEPERSRFLHPVVRVFRVWSEAGSGGASRPQLLAEQHIVEDFHSLWVHHTAHVLPLARFLEDVGARRLLAASAAAAAAAEVAPPLTPALLDSMAVMRTSAAGASHRSSSSSSTTRIAVATTMAPWGLPSTINSTTMTETMTTWPFRSHRNCSTMKCSCAIVRALCL